MARRPFRSACLCLAVAFGVTAVPALADEFLGYVKSVDVEARTLVVTEKEEQKDITVKLSDKAEFENRKGEVEVLDLGKFEKMHKKAVEKSKKGRGPEVRVIHADGVASKIVQAAGKKKAEPKAEEEKKAGN